MSRHTYNKQGWKKTRRHRSGRKRVSSIGVKNFILFCVAIAIAASLALVIFMAILSRNLPNPNSLTERSISQTTKIYDSTGEHLLYEIFGDENRTLKQLQEGFCLDDDNIDFDEAGIPLFALQATIAAEDRKFCSHGGFDVKGLARAVFQNLIGNRVGGSTLTQQLVKNAILSNEKTVTRKVKELVLAVELERRYSKDEILQIYFNEIPYGSTYYGIEAAAQNFYRKPVSELTLGEAASLAALPKAPTTYLNNPDRHLARRNYILGEMEELGFITEEEQLAAQAEDNTIESKLININAPHFVLYVKEQLEETYGRRTVEEGGLKVTTTLDFDLQMIAEEEVAKGVEEIGELKGFSNAALVAINPDNGFITAMVGSKDFFDTDIDGQVNVTTRLRQPGSSFKPIIYTKALEMGYTPNTVLWDVVTDFPTVTGTYTPHNYDLKERGPVRLRTALQGSLNIPAVKMIYMVGFENALDFANSLGYTSFKDYSNYGLSLVLGGGEVQLVEHVNAYATFANDGKRNALVSILSVEDANGVMLQEWKEKDGKNVLDENTARTITHILSDNDARTPFFGANSALNIGRPVAAKTGTTNDYRDGWLIGYTPQMAMGVWAGNNDNSAMKRGSGGSSAAGPIWNAVMRRAHASLPVEGFTPPTIKATGKAALDGLITSETIIIDKASGKLATKFTPNSQKEERLFAEYHSLLHYVDRGDPTGSIPKKPEKDSNYEAWEAAITTWIATQEEETGMKITQSAPPTQDDDVHIPKNIPNVKIKNPTEGSAIENRQLFVSIQAKAKRGAVRAELYLDGQFLQTDSSSPFSFSLTLPSSVRRGFHTLKAVVYDDVDNSGSDTVGIQVQDDPGEVSLELIDPKNGQTIEKTKETFTVVAQLKNPRDYLTATVFAQPLSGGTRVIVGQKVVPTSPFMTFDWLLPENGTWALSVSARPKDGSADLSTTGVLVEIVEGRPQAEKDEGQGMGDEETVAEKPTEIFTPEEDLTIF